jgi:hypothetical protein
MGTVAEQKARLKASAEAMYMELPDNKRQKMVEHFKNLVAFIEGVSPDETASEVNGDAHGKKSHKGHGKKDE